MGDFLRELTRRKVWLFGGLYLGLGWIVLQVAVVIEQTLELPNWIDQSVLILLTLGFPFALLLAWAQESQGSKGGNASTAGEASASGVPAPAPRRNLSIAVLPFDDLSRESDFAEVADGAPEDILTRLAQYEALNVVSRNSSFAYKGTSPDIREVGAALNVKYVLEGSFRGTGESVRVTAQLIETQEGGHIYSENFDLPSDGWQSGIDGIVDTLVTEIFSTLFRVEGKVLLAGSLEALTPAELGYFATLHVADNSLEALKDAQSWMEAALKKAPEDGNSHAKMARILSALSWWEADEAPSLEKQAQEHLNKAKRSGNSDLDMLISMSGTAFNLGRLSDLEVFVDQLCSRYPKVPAGWGFATALHVMRANWQEALIASANGQKLCTPRFPFYSNFIEGDAYANFSLGRYEEAARACRKFLMSRADTRISLLLIAALVESNQLDDARTELTILKQHQPDISLATAKTLRRPGEAHKALNEALLDGLTKAGLE